VQNLQEEFPSLDDFIKDAKVSDGGEASAQKHLCLSLGTVASSFLGEGDWTPRPPSK
jgi:hypothetical protein